MPQSSTMTRSSASCSGQPAVACDATRIAARMSVSVAPGHTQLARTPCGPNDFAIVFVSVATAALSDA